MGFLFVHLLWNLNFSKNHTFKAATHHPVCLKIKNYSFRVAYNLLGLNFNRIYFQLMYCIARIVRFVRHNRKTRNSAAKMNEEKRANESEKMSLDKVSKENEDENQNSTIFSGTFSENEFTAEDETEAAIFTLNIDCFDMIFNYLSLKDIHTIGLTSKQFQRIAGSYFGRNFKSSEKFSGIDGIYTVYSDNNGVINRRTQTSGFNEFINYFSHYYENVLPLRYIQQNCDALQSLNHIYLVCLQLNSVKIECLRQILPRLEIVQIRQCTIDGDFYDCFLKYCTNLRSIYVQDDLGYILDENQNPWLLEEYPRLDHLQLIPRYSFKINELNSFFERNPRVQSFSTSSRCLWENRHEIKSNIKIEKLEVQILIHNPYNPYAS